jgi:hypothetical protein
MRARFHNKLIAALLAPAFLTAGAAQGLPFMRCGSLVRMSCCCPENAAPASAFSLGVPRRCDKLVVPAAPSQNVERATPTVPAPVLFAVLGSSASRESASERLRRAQRPDRPPGPSPVLANCALLI